LLRGLALGHGSSKIRLGFHLVSCGLKSQEKLPPEPGDEPPCARILQHATQKNPVRGHGAIHIRVDT